MAVDNGVGAEEHTLSQADFSAPWIQLDTLADLATRPDCNGLRRNDAGPHPDRDHGTHLAAPVHHDPASREDQAPVSLDEPGEVHGFPFSAPP
jgi:hypothetical protein